MADQRSSCRQRQNWTTDCRNWLAVFIEAFGNQHQVPVHKSWWNIRANFVRPHLDFGSNVGSDSAQSRGDVQTPLEHLFQAAGEAGMDCERLGMAHNASVARSDVGHCAG